MVLIDLDSAISHLGLVSALFKPTPSFRLTSNGLSSEPLASSWAALLHSGSAPDSSNSSVLSANSSSSAGSSSIPILGSIASSSYEHPSSSGDTVSATDASCSPPDYSADVPLEPFPPYAPAEAVVYRYRQQSGVNLGSWFVQEQWMEYDQPIFRCATQPAQAELDVASGWGGVDGAKAALEKHWDEWITESDLVWLASIGINTVRLPIGYWSLGPEYCKGTPFEPYSEAYTGSWTRVVRTINLAAKHGLGILVDLHGAPGSQNGQAHSGISDGQVNLFNDPTNIQLTLNALTFLTNQLVNVNNVVGIELLNEPSNDATLPDVYNDFLSTLRQLSPEAASFPFYIHDGFDLQRFSDWNAARNDFVVVDHHQYFVFGDEASRDIPINDLTTSLTQGDNSVYDQLSSASDATRRNVIVGEWSCALTPEATAQSSDPQEEQRRYCTGQLETYINSTAGWAFWSLKSDGCDGNAWCFQSTVGTVLPSTFFSYPRPAMDLLAQTLGVSTNASLSAATDMSAAVGLMTLPDPTDGSEQAFVVGQGFDSSAEGFETIPSYRLTVQHIEHKRSFDIHSNSFHRGLAKRRGAMDHLLARDDSPDRLADPSWVRGEADGYKAAWTFAAFGGSRLGFTGQYILDSFTLLGDQIGAGDQVSYRKGFLQGLASGETDVMQSLALTSGSLR